MIFTSNFEIAGQLPQAVNIAREPPEWFQGKHYEPLMPPTKLLYAFIEGKMTWAEYRVKFSQEVLSKVKPDEVVDEVGNDAILLCWCPPQTNCHRRLVADWIETELGLYIAEYPVP